MLQHSTVHALFCTVVMLGGCSSADGGDADTTASTTVTTDAGGSSGLASTSTSGATDTSTGTPTSTPTTDASTTDVSTTDAPATTSGSTTSTDGTGSESSGGSDTTTGGGALTASSILEPKSGSMTTGTVLFTDLGGGTVDLVITLAGVEPPGTHALHIHEIPDCSAPDGTSTGNHWNPPPTMLGELGTVEIADDGTGVFMKTDLWSIGTGESNDVVDHSIIIHADANGGTRIACGVITKD